MAPAAKVVGAFAITLSILPVAQPQLIHSQVVTGSRFGSGVPVLTTNIPYADATPILEALAETLPPALKARTSIELKSAWPDWVSRHNEEIRERLDHGDQDSIINFWYYGTSFTTLPPLSVRNIAALGGPRSSRIVQGRLEDLIAGIASPGTNERLQFARAVIGAQVSDPTTLEGKDAVRRHLLDMRRRTFAEREKRKGALQSATEFGDQRVRVANSFTFFRDRGLSSDTSILPSFTIEGALEAFKSGGIEMPRLSNIRRVAIVGPGLDFTDKADGYDFYPLQTIQPFAVIDSLIRLGLSKSDDLRLTTFDLSVRIIRHIETARQRARTGDAYILQLPLDRDEHWKPALVAYWRRFGDRIGEEVKATTAPPSIGNVSVRAVSVRPEIVTLITTQELNIVLERLQPLPIDEQFDLIIATNVLIYYDVFEQNLALANVARMLRPGGLFVSNSRVFPAVALKLLDEYFKVSHTDTQSDYLFWYQRQ